MKIPFRRRARGATISRVLSAFVALLMGATFIHAWMNGTVAALGLSLGLALALVVYVLGRFPD